MQVFLDSNFCYKDPFMSKNIFNKLLLELAEEAHIKLYMSEVVKKEIINNFEKELTKSLDVIKDHEGKINKLIKGDLVTPIMWVQTVEHYLMELDSHLTSLEDEGIIEIIPYSNDILPELVDRSIKRIKPFTEKKLEFRDGIIWLSYVEYAKSKNLEGCYLITKNSEDFLKNNEIHPDLLKDSRSFTIYKNAEDFIKNCSEAQSLKKRLDWVETQDFSHHPDEVLDLISTQCFEKVHDACVDYVNKAFSMPLPSNIITFDTEWYELNDIELKEVTQIDVSVVLDTIIISGYLGIEADYDVYERNPSYERGELEYFLMGSADANLYVKFSISINEDLEVEDMDIDEIDLD